MTPNSYVLLHSPLTGPVAWGQLPTLLREHGYDVIVINVQDDDEAPFAERYVTLAAGQISVADPAPPTVFVAHSGAGPLLPAITANLPAAWRPPGGYILLDAGIPRTGQPSRLDLLREEDDKFAVVFRDSLDVGARFPTWRVDELADVVPSRDDRIDLVRSLRPRGPRLLHRAAASVRCLARCAMWLPANVGGVRLLRAHCRTERLASRSPRSRALPCPRQSRSHSGRSARADSTPVI